MDYILLLSDGEKRAFYAQNDADAVIVAEVYASQASLRLIEVFKSMQIKDR